MADADLTELCREQLRLWQAMHDTQAAFFVQKKRILAAYAEHCPDAGLRCFVIGKHAIYCDGKDVTLGSPPVVELEATA